MIPESGSGGMEAVHRKPRPFQFGAFELDPNSAELRKHGIKLKLQHQPLQILAVLLERPGEVVSRDEIQKRLWPDNTYVDFENAINSAIRKLRDALGDTAENPRFIETLSRRGYRFIYPISGGVGPSPAAPPEVSGGRHRLWWAGLCAFVVAMIGLSFWIAKSKKEITGPETPGLYRFTSYPGVETMPAFSPDGKQIAYVRAEHDPIDAHLWRKEAGQANIYVKLVGAATELRLTNHAGADYYPAWSPDGQYIAFYRDEPGASGIYIVSALGGQERRITYEEEAECTGMAWLPDGRHVVLSRFFEGSHRSALIEISLDTGKERSITLPPAGAMGDVWPAVSPDKKTLAFIRFNNSKGADACFAALHGNSLRCWPLKGDWPQGLTWTASSDGIIVSAFRTGPYQLWRYGLNGGTPAALTSGEEDASLPTSSSQGNHLAYVLYQRRVSLWELNADPSRSVSPGEAKPIASSTGTQSDPAFSPDGRTVAFLSDQSGSGEIWAADTDTQVSTQLTHFGGAGSPSWSPDGRQIAFDSQQGGSTNIFVISADGGVPRRVTTSPAENCVPSWSLDGNSIYFASDRSGDFQIWRVPAATGETPSHPAIQVTRGGGFRALESPDGNNLYYAKGRGKTGLWRRNLLDGKEEPVLESLQQWGWWAVAPRSIYFFELSRSVHPQVHLKAFDMAEHRLRELGTVRYPVMSATPAIAVSRDGRHLVYTQIDSMEADIMLMANVR